MIFLYGVAIWFVEFTIDAADKKDYESSHRRDQHRDDAAIEDVVVDDYGDDDDDDDDDDAKKNKGSNRQQDVDTFVESLPDVGYLFGSTKGKKLFLFFQLGNFICFMPVALDLVSQAVLYLVYNDGDGCLGYFTIGCWVALFGTVQIMKQWNHISWISYVTVILCATVSFILFPYSFITTNYDETDGYDKNTAQGPPFAFGNPNPTWDGYASALSNFIFGFAPMMVLFEVRNNMRKATTNNGGINNESKKSISETKLVMYYSASLQFLLYMVPSLICVFRWGYNIENPVTNQLSQKSWIGYFINFYIVISTALDFVIVVVIFTEWLQDHILPKKRPWQEPAIPSFPSTDNGTNGIEGDDNDHKTQNIISRFLCTILHCFYSLIVVLAIPNFSTLVGIGSGLTLVGAHSWGIATLLEWNKYALVSDSNYLRAAVWILGFLSFLCTIYVMVASLYDIVVADYSAGFFCLGT